MAFLFQYHNKWVWELAVYYVLIFIALIFFTGLYLFSHFNFYALFILFLLIPVIFLFIRYQKINKLVAVLKGCISAQNGEVVASLLYFKNKSIPGIAILRDDVIILIPVFGRRHKIFFDKLKVIKEVNSMPGEWLLGKRVFNIEFEKKPSVLFAVPGSVGKRWGLVLKLVGSRKSEVRSS